MNLKQNVKVLYNKEDERTIVFIPMVHVGKEKYYESVKMLIDSLRQNGYIFFFEGLSMKKGLDSVQSIEYSKKLRKFLGYNLSFDEENLSLPYYYNSKRYQKQDYNNLGITKKDINVDLTLKAVIDSFENKYFKINLNEYDLATNLNSKYKCKDNYKKYTWSITQEFRNPYLSKRILNTKHKKLAIIYGKAHWMYIYPSLRDNGYQLIEGKLFSFF